MKKPGILAFVIVCCVFLGFLLGFFVGRNIRKEPIHVSKLPAATAPTGESGPNATEESAGIININSATAEQLQTLPGIGPVLAQRIIQYRDENGPFTDISQLTVVSGIGTQKLNAILDYVTVGN